MPTPKPKLPNESQQMPPAKKTYEAGGKTYYNKKNADSAQADPNVAAPKNKKKRNTASSGKEPVARQASQQWATDVLKGQFETNPWINKIMDPANLDVRNNPNLKPVADSIQNELQEDWLGNLRQLDSATEARGRGGSPLAAALRARETEETQEAAANALNQLYAGAYENAANRQLQGLGMSMEAQARAAGIPIEWMNADTNLKGVRTQRYGIDKQFQADKARLGLARQQFNFEKQMGLANAQQDALSDYVSLLSAIGGMGGTQSGGGQFIPTQNPFVAGILGAGGGYLQGKEYFS